MCAHAQTSTVSNYPALQAMWDEAFEIVKETEMRARILGVSAQMKKLDFLFGGILSASYFQPHR